MVGTTAVGRLVTVVGCLSLLGCSNLDRPDDAAWLPAPGEVGATMIDCDDTFFAEMIDEALEANATEPTGLVHLECWRSSSADSFDQDADALAVLLISGSGGVELDQPSRCGPNLGRHDPLEDGTVALFFCSGNVEYSEGTMVAGFYSVVPASTDESNLLWDHDTNSPNTDLVTRLSIDWVVVVGVLSDD